MCFASSNDPTIVTDNYVESLFAIKVYIPIQVNPAKHFSCLDDFLSRHFLQFILL